MKKSTLVLLVFSVVLLFYSEPAMAHNCSGLQDCYQQSKLAALAAALIALLLSLLLDFSPIGYWKGLLEAITGRDILTGDKLAWWQRALNLVPGGKGARTAAKAVDEISDTAKAAGKMEERAKAVNEVGDAAKAESNVAKAKGETAKAVDEVDDVTNVNDPYNIAKQGGKHSGFYNEYAKKPDSQIRKGIESINKQISEHQKKIEAPQKFISDFDNLDPRQQKALPDKWQSDINRQNEQKTILEGLLKER
jgi:hypothetical protein